jgi:hypothetical protein
MKRALGIGVAALAALLCWSASASAAPVDVKSAHKALAAYRAYLHSLVAEVHAAQKNDDAFIALVGSQCANVLAPLNQVSPSSLNKTALTEFGEELGGDIVLAAAAVDRPALTRLTTRVSKLHWSTDARTRSIAHSLAAQQTLFTMSTSDVCGNARALAASNGRTVPPGTPPFVQAFIKAARAAGLGPLQKTINRFRTASDKGTVRKVNRLVKRAKADLNKVAHAEVPKIVNTLGLPT